MGFGTIGAVAIGKKPFSGTDPVSPLIDPKGHEYYAGKDVCIELQGAAHKISRFPGQYKEQFALHHFKGEPMPASTRTYTASVVIKKTEQVLATLGVYLPGSEYVTAPRGLTRPRSVECVLEHTYPPKDGESSRREAERKRGFEKDKASGWTISDCCMWDVGVKLLERGVLVTLPPAEFDATCQVRLLGDWIVIVPSGDSDIPLYPSGVHSGEVHLLQAKPKGVSIHTTRSKAKVMSTMFTGDDANDALEALGAGTLPKEFEFVQLEALYLACCLATPHDYHTRLRPTSSTEFKDPYTNVTGVSMKTWKLLCELVWLKFVPAPTPRRVHAASVKAVINAACDTVISVVKDQQGLLCWSASEDWNLPDQIRAAFDAFMNQPVAAAPGSSTASAYVDVLAKKVESSASQSHTSSGGGASSAGATSGGCSTLSAAEMQKYEYRGKCVSCPLMLDAPWEIPIDRVVPLLQKIAPSGTRDGPAAKLPKMLLGDLVRNTGYVGTLENWRIEGSFDSVDYVLNILDRVATTSEMEWEVVYLPPDPPEEERPPGFQCIYPEGYEYKVDGDEVNLAIVRGRCLQSYGVSGKEKTDRMGGAAYLCYAALETNMATGRVLKYPNGSSEAKDGILAVSCPHCKNPLRCRHGSSVLAAMCRVKEEDWMSSTTPLGYWKKHGKKPAYKSTSAIKLGELATRKEWLSDIVGSPVEQSVIDSLQYVGTNPIQYCVPLYFVREKNWARSL